MMKHPVFGLFLALAIGGSTTGSWKPRTFRQPSEKMFEALGAETAVCPESRVDRFEDHIAVRCATTTESLKSIRKRWRKAVRRGSLAESVQWDASPWRKAGKTERRMHVLYHGTPVEIAFDETAGSLTVSWPESFPGCHAGYAVTWFAMTDDVYIQRVKERVYPRYPEEARTQRASGSVIGSFLLDETGRVADVCVTGVHPLRVGFEKASEEALFRSRFEPAQRDGRPVAVAVTFGHMFTILDGNYLSFLLQDYFNSVRTSDVSGR